jgi:hypothetical protein
MFATAIILHAEEAIFTANARRTAAKNARIEWLRVQADLTLFSRRPYRPRSGPLRRKDIIDKSKFSLASLSSDRMEYKRRRFSLYSCLRSHSMIEKALPSNFSASFSATSNFSSFEDAIRAGYFFTSYQD